MTATHKCFFSTCKKPVVYRVELKWERNPKHRIKHSCYDHIPGSKTGVSREELEKGNEWYGIEKL